MITSTSKGGAVEVAVTMPMIDDQPENFEVGSVPAAIPTQAKSPPPKNVKDAYKRMKTTKDAAEMCAILTICCGLICAGICMTVTLVALSLVHLYLLIVGALNLENCPAQRLIPIYLVVAGAFTILRAILNWYYTWCHAKIKKEGSNDQIAKPSPFSNIINLFLFIWLICGAVWVFGANVDTFDDRNSAFYCDKLTYWTAYIYIIVSFVVMALSLVICCCLCSCIVCGILVGAAADANGSGTNKRADI